MFPYDANEVIRDAKILAEKMAGPCDHVMAVLAYKDANGERGSKLLFEFGGDPGAAAAEIGGLYSSMLTNVAHSMRQAEEEIRRQLGDAAAMEFAAMIERTACEAFYDKSGTLKQMLSFDKEAKDEAGHR